MRVSDGAISWDDFDGALVASLPSHFGMPEIERYMSIGCPKIHLRLYSSVMRAHGLDEAYLIMLFPMSLSGVAQPLYGMEEGIARGLWPEPSPSDSKEKKSSRGHRLGDVGLRETSYFIPLAPSPTGYYSSCIEADATVLSSWMNLHCAYHQDPRHDTNYWVPFELTPTAPWATACQGPSVPFILRPDDEDLEGRDV
ncbi:hypothetical protein AAG906_038378 [Vitis piasezkii]